jgi:hypothetical protein
MDDQNVDSTWLLSRVGNALDALAYREINRGTMQPQLVSQQAYGQDEFGNVYMLGQPAQRPTPVQSVGGNGLLMLLLIGVGIYALAGK